MRNIFFLSITICILTTFRLYGQVDTTGVNKLFKMDLTDLMNQKVVTASKYSQNSAEAASSIGVITADEIKQFGFRTLGEALNSQRGMFLSNDKNYLSLGSRGFSRPTDYNNRVVIMIDGHIFNEIVYGSAFMGNELGINLDYFERIEIIRGPGALVYGSGSMLNIINLITKKGAAINGVSVSAGAGSYGRYDLSTVYGEKIKNTDISVSGIGGTYKGENYYFSELDAPETNFGKSVGNDWEKFIGFQTSVTNRNFKISSSFSNRSKGIPTGAFSTDLTGNVRSVDKRFFIESSYRKEFKNNSSMLLRLFFDDYHYTGSYPFGGVDTYDASIGQWTGGEAQYYLEAGKKNIFTAGLEYKYAFRNDYLDWDNTTTYFNKNFPFSFFSIYAQDQLKIVRNLTLTGGLRYDHYSVFGHSASPRLALVYKYSKASSVKLLYSEAFRIPNLYESYYESKDEHRSNPDIRSEKIKAIEVAWTHNLCGAFYGNLSLYRFSTYNLIDQVYDDSDGLTEFLNIGRAIGNGAEYEIKYNNKASKTQGYLNFSIQKTIDNSTKKTLSNSPEFLVKSGIALKVSSFFTVVPEVFYESGRITLKGKETDEVILFNLGFNSSRILKHFEISLKVRNLFDTKYFTPGGYEHVQDKLIQDSRNIYVKMTAHF